MATWGQGQSLVGAPGQVGPAGIRGTQIFETQGPPTDSTASAFANDLAIDVTSAGFPLYQRTASGWPSSSTFNLRGPMGFAGVDSNFATGTGAPPASLFPSGNAVYLSDTGEIFTRSNGNAWVDTNENFRGPQGIQGIQGVAGQNAPRGVLTYTGSSNPPSDPSTLTPPAVAGDLYYRLGGPTDPTLYVLGN